MHSCTTNHKNIDRSKTYKRSKGTHGPLPFLYNFNVSILESVTIRCSLENYGSRLRQNENEMNRALGHLCAHIG